VLSESTRDECVQHGILVWKIERGDLSYPTEALANNQAEELCWAAQVEKYETDEKFQFLPVYLDKEVLSSPYIPYFISVLNCFYRCPLLE